MTIEQLRNFYQARPFRPFIMHLADGRRLAVHHPEFLATAPSGRTVTVYQPDETSTVVDLLQVTDLEIKSSSTKSGPRKRS
ncbi:MAG: hypothetical protein ACHRXM_11850 [Isosphaerales bacterium]